MPFWLRRFWRNRRRGSCPDRSAKSRRIDRDRRTGLRLCALSFARHRAPAGRRPGGASCRDPARSGGRFHRSRRGYGPECDRRRSAGGQHHALRQRWLWRGHRDQQRHFCSAFDDGVADTAGACTETTDPAEARFVWLRPRCAQAITRLRQSSARFPGLRRRKRSRSRILDLQHSAAVCLHRRHRISRRRRYRQGPVDEDGSPEQLVPGQLWLPRFWRRERGCPGGAVRRRPQRLPSDRRVDTAPGNKSATDAINTRFDLYSGGTITAAFALTSPTDRVVPTRMSART